MARPARRSAIAAALALLLVVFAIGEIIVDDRPTDPVAGRDPLRRAELANRRLAFAVDVSHAPERGPEGLDFGHPFSRGVHVVGDLAQRIRVWPDGDNWTAVSLPVLGAEIIELRGPSPTGPFVETARHALTANPWPSIDRWVYEPLVFEPEPGADVMMFNSSPADTGLVVDNVELYGPQFMDTTRPPRQR